MTRGVEFTANEARLLDDRLMRALKEGGWLELGLWKKFSYHLASLAVYGEGEIGLTEEELWAVARVVSPLDMVGSAPSGETLKKKVYKALLDLELPQMKDAGGAHDYAYQSTTEGEATDGTDKEVEPSENLPTPN